MASHSISQTLIAASESDRMEFAHFLMRELAAFGLEAGDATARQVVAAFDRFATRGGEHGGEGR